MAKLSSYVYVDGEPYGPDDDVPAAIAARITNPNAWEGGEVPAFEPAAGPTPADAPPRAGKGSGREVWAQFAEANGVNFDAEATRDEIIAACEQAGVVEVDGQ